MKITMRYRIVLFLIWGLFSVLGCTGDGSTGIQSDTDYNATMTQTGATPLLDSFEGVVSEDASKGVLVGIMTVSNLVESGIIALILSGTGAENFLVDISGVITVASGASLDYETVDTYMLLTRAIDSSGNNIVATTVIITVTDVIEEVASTSETSTTKSQ